MSREKFIESMQQGYKSKGASITLGKAMYEGEVEASAAITIPLKTLNRHGLIAGATGTGKTKTIQLLAEKLANEGVPSLLMDLKGDLSGLAAAGEASKGVLNRHKLLQLDYHPSAFNVELLSLSKQPGVKLRATVSEFGPMLFAKILGLNDLQSSIVSLIFKFCDDSQLPLLDLKDFKKVLNFALNEGKDDFTQNYGRVALSSGSAILRKVIELEQQGADHFFGEPSFEVEDLMRVDRQGRGGISILRLLDIQDKPKLFSSFMLCLLAEVYAKLPEEGDLERPKLMIFIDEAHLLFEHATDELLSQIESIVKLIRSKGVGVFFCTQNPVDIPNDVLAQLGLKVQHALRAFTAKDRKAIKLTAENYPISEFYKTDQLLTSLGIGEAAITALDEKGRPTPLAATMLCAPQSRMDVLTKPEIDQLITRSTLVSRYNRDFDRDSAYEMLSRKLEAAAAQSTQTDATKTPTTKTQTKADATWINKLSKNTMVRQLGRTLLREVTRGLLGVLGVKRRR